MTQIPTTTTWEKFQIPTVAFLATAAVSLLLAFVFLDAEKAENAFISFGYANVALLTALFAWVCLPKSIDVACKTRPDRKTLLLLVLCLIGALFLYSREGGGFKISFDEEVLSNVAQNMYRDHLPVMRESTLQNVASFEMIDKRPVLFPFILSLVHTVFGYNVANAFYLNFALTIAFLFLLGNVLTNTFGRTAAYFSISLVCFSPIIAQNASGGGFDMLNATLALLVTSFAMKYWENPSSSNLTRLAIATALSSHVRYESTLIAIPVILLITIVWIRKKKIDLPPILIAIPITYIPLVWQFRAIKTAAESFQYKQDGSGSFSLDYMADNLAHAYRFFFIPNLSYAGSPFVGFIGFAGLLAILAYWALKKVDREQRTPARVSLMVMGIYPLLHFGLILTFYFGQFDDPIVSRLSLPVLTLFFITGGVLLAFLYQRKGFPRFVVCALVLCSGLYASKMYSTHRYSTSGAIPHRSAWILEFADNLPKGNYLFITAMPRIFEIYGYNNIGISRARTKLSDIKYHLDLSTYDDVYVLQNGKVEIHENTITRSLLPFNDLGPAAKLELLDEVSFTPFNYCQLSRIDSIDLSLDVAPKKDEATEFETGQTLRLTPEQIFKWKRSLP